MNFRKPNLNILLILFYISAIILAGYVLINKFVNDEGNEVIGKEIVTQSSLNVFGLDIENLVEYTNEVHKNETLSDILSAFSLNGLTPEEIAASSKDIFNVRTIRPGKNYFAYVSDDSLGELKYFVYEKDPINYVVFDLNDTLNIYEGKKEVKLKTSSQIAEINNSLYATLEENDASPELAVRLSQIFAWQVDFYAIQKGDRFKVIYEEQFIDDKFVGVGKILGAYFKHKGEEFFAIPFEQDSIRQFFDQNNKSLRKAFLKAPLEFSRISSRYSKKRFHPILKRSKPHLGTDYAAPYGTPIRTIGDGVVIEAGYSRGNGNYVKVRHNSTYTTQYLHMSKFAKGVKRGTKVKQGQVIGYVGSTGLATGPHLCFRFWKNGVQVDPFREKIPPSHPVKKELIAEYEVQKKIVMDELNNLKFPDEQTLAKEDTSSVKSNNKL